MSLPEDGIFSDNAAFAERLLADYLQEPGKVPPEWRTYFSRLLKTERTPAANLAPPTVVVAARPTRLPIGDGAAKTSHLDAARLQDRVQSLIRAYRGRGHLAAKLDPLGLVRPEPVDLSPEAHGISEADMDRLVSAASVGGPAEQTLGELVERLRTTYCRYIGAQFMHIDEPAVREWLQQRMERSQNRIRLSRPDQLRILTRLTDAVIFEQFVRKKYVGAKTFSLEGSESLIPLLDLAIVKASRQGIAEIVVGMAHRGRLNVLANIIGKRPQEIFWEFDDPGSLHLTAAAI